MEGGMTGVQSYTQDKISSPADANDVCAIRLQFQQRAFRTRDYGLSRRRVREIRRALRRLHSLETMVASIYTSQIRTDVCEHNRALIAAMCSAMSHLQDYQVRLYEFGGRPAKYRWVWWLLGLTVGLGSRVLGRTIVLKTDMWMEKRSLRRYETLLWTVEWDGETRRMIQGNIADQHAHIGRWRNLLCTAEPDY
jgi:demethoxyubiquinone hydroxylase (CLK1/Coq7/Cat5 family)